MKPLRIVVTAIQHLVDKPSGGSRIAYDEAKHWALRGADVWVIAPDVLGSRAEHEVHEGINLLRYTITPRPILDPRRAWAHQISTQMLLRKYVPRPVDVLHGHAPLSYIAACGLYGRAAVCCYTVHSPVIREMGITWGKSGIGNRVRSLVGLPLLNRVERKCLLKSHVVLSLSEFTRELIRETQGNELARRIQVVPGWADLDYFRILPDPEGARAQLGLPSDRPVLFTLRRLVPRMGLDRLLRACRRILDLGLEFVLVIGGDGPLRTELETLAAELRLGESVRFWGRIPDETLPLVYGASDAFVLPTSQLECFGLIAIEALACGRPVLATPVGAIPEILNQVEPQWICKGADEQSIAALILRFLRGELPKHLAEDLRSFVASRFDKRAMLNRMTDRILSSAIPTINCSLRDVPEH